MRLYTHTHTGYFIKRILKKVYYKILWLLPKRLATKIRYEVSTHKKFNMNNPKDFNQKICYLLANKYGDLETKCADKYKMREYVKEKGLEEYLPELYGVYNNAKDINFESLPKEYVLKTNHGCGNTIIKNKNDVLDEKKVIKKLNKSLKENYGKKSLEYQYCNIKPLIVCEEYIKEGQKKNPTDYKFYCFRGKVGCILVCSERETDLKLDYYDLKWNKKENYSKKEYRSDKVHEKPKNLEKMIDIASKLSVDFPFVRIDLYNTDGKIYIGEMTFTSSGGIEKDTTDEFLEYFGDFIEI